ncbi:hypothetical protein KY386_03005 [Candidatus Parcubacteria bacterium]|nr:hypothetical protein [Candidatus Parcubacteria bacterium]
MSGKDHNNTLSIKRRFFGFNKPWIIQFYLVDGVRSVAMVAITWTIGWLLGIPWDWGRVTLFYYLGLPAVGVALTLYPVWKGLKAHQLAGMLLGKLLEPRHPDGLSNNRDPERLVLWAPISVRSTTCYDDDLP